MRCLGYRCRRSGEDVVVEAERRRGSEESEMSFAADPAVAADVAEVAVVLFFVAGAEEAGEASGDSGSEQHMVRWQHTHGDAGARRQ